MAFFFSLQRKFSWGKIPNYLKKKKKKSYVVTWNGCTPLLKPATRLQSQACQPRTPTQAENHQLRDACTGPVKAGIIRQLKKMPPSKACIYPFRSALGSWASLSSRNDRSSISPEIYMSNDCQYSSHSSLSPSLSSCAHPTQSLTGE